MAATSRKTEMRFRAGEVGFVFYEEAGAAAAFAGERGRTFAFGTIGDAAAWLVRQFPETPAVAEPAS